MPLFLMYVNHDVHIHTNHAYYIINYVCTQNCIAMLSLNPYTLSGFEPGSSVPEADALCMFV
jgi:hypothetical protein